MKKSLFVSLLCLISACTTLTGHERLVLRDLKSDGISVENPTGMWEKTCQSAFSRRFKFASGIW